MMKKIFITNKHKKTKRGFTLIEVMLVLAITGLMLVGVLGGTYRNIEQQRYVDSYRSFSEYLRQMYNEVQSPESWAEDSDGEIAAGRSDEVIYGKALIFGPMNGSNQVVKSVTIVGNAADRTTESDFIKSLGESGAHFACNTVDTYTTRWESSLKLPATASAEEVQDVKGTLIIARSPSSGTIHTRWKETWFNVNSDHDCANASSDIEKRFKDEPENFYSRDVDICVKSDSNSVVRAIQIEKDARNSSGILMLTEEESLDLGTSGGETLRCR